VLLILAAQFLPEQQQLLLFWLPELGSSGLFFADQNCPILLLFWRQNWVVLAELGWILALVRHVFVTI